jgi:hypothetical protein
MYIYAKATTKKMQLILCVVEWLEEEVIKASIYWTLITVHSEHFSGIDLFNSESNLMKLVLLLSSSF